MSHRTETATASRRIPDSQDGAPSTFFGRAIKRLTRAVRDGAPDERREHRRVPAHGDVELLIQDDSDGEKQVSVNLVDISPRGLQFRSKTEIPAGLTVMLNDGRLTLTGTIRRCSPEGKEFVLGVELRSDEDPRPMLGDKLLT